MKKQRKRKWAGSEKRNGGFTLIELIVVITIMALLAGIMVPFYLGYIRKAKEQQHLMEARQLSIAVTMMMLENGLSAEGRENNEIYMSIFWRKLGDEEHPLYGSFPSEWDPEGTVTVLVIDDDLILKEIGYCSPDGAGEVWMIEHENGVMQIEVRSNSR